MARLRGIPIPASNACLAGMTAIFDPDHDVAVALRAALAGDQVVPMTTTEALSAFLVKNPQTRSVVLGPSVKPAAALHLASTLRANQADLGMVLVRYDVDESLRQQALRYGVHRVVDAADTAGLQLAVRSFDEAGIGQGAPPPLALPTPPVPEIPQGANLTWAALASNQLTAPNPGQPAGSPAPVPLADLNAPLAPAGLTPPMPVQPPPKPQRVITVFATKGGIGKTTLATNIAASLAAGGQRQVALVDLDLRNGDVATVLRLNPTTTLADLADRQDDAQRPARDGAQEAAQESAEGSAQDSAPDGEQPERRHGTIDDKTLDALSTRHSAGLSAVSPPDDPVAARRIPVGTVIDTVRALRERCDHVVIDTPAEFDDQVLAALDLSDLIVLVTSMDLPSLKSLQRTLATLRMLGYPSSSVRIVLNRADAEVGLSGQDVQNMIGAPIWGYVPSSRAVPASLNSGTPLVLSDPRHSVSQAIRAFVDQQVLGVAPPVAVTAGPLPPIQQPRRPAALPPQRPARRGLFGLLGRRH